MRTSERVVEAANEGGELSSFSQNVLALMERVEYRRCESGEDIEAIYRLRYKAYRQNGFLAENASQMMSDELDDAPNCYRFGVFIDNELVSTVRIHHITKEQPYGPIMSVFGDILTPRLERTLLLLVRGRANRDIARELGQSEATTKRDVADLLHRFDAPNRVALAAIAWRLGLSPDAIDPRYDED